MLSEADKAVYEFAGFRLEPAERRLTCAGTAVELSQRYLDALLLMVRHPGALITKDRFMAEVWQGIPVTDEALTQCVRSLRKALGDDAARPRFIETVPRHGYRFIAAVTCPALEGFSGRASTSASAVAATADAAEHDRSVEAPSGVAAPTTAAAVSAPSLVHTEDPAAAAISSVRAVTSADAEDSAEAGTANLSTIEQGSHPRSPSTGTSPADSRTDSSFKFYGAGSDFLLLAAAGLAGGAAAGLVGGIGYGLVAASEPPDGTGAISILLVLTCLCLGVGLLGGFGVGSGIALGRLLAPGRLFAWMIGGALGGLIVGALGRLIGIDAFSLLVGSRPTLITGGSEGLIIGALTGAALWQTGRDVAASPLRVAATGGLFGALAGLLVTLGGGTMMAGSLAGLAAAHPAAPLGTLLGTLSPLLLLAAGAIEGATFVAALSLAFVLALRSRAAP